MSTPGRPLTLMAVHAHPDDEASTTGGILAKYSAEGVRTVLVTCTNGELGDLPGGTKPGEPGHDEAELIELRRRELEESCRILGVAHLETLGYRDSGMMGWPSNDAPGAFWTVPVAEAAAPLADLMRRYRPDVVVTYDANGFYGHPDHIQAHRITLAALDSIGGTARLYFPAFRRSGLGRFRDALSEAGLEPPAIEETEFGVPDEEIVATIDCRDFAEVKMAALRAHGSQEDNIFFVRLGFDLFTEMFGTEEFVSGQGSADPGRPVEVDLFPGRSASS